MTPAVPLETATRGCSQLSFAVGGITTSITSRDPTLRLALPEEARRFAVEPTGIHIQVDASWGAHGESHADPPLFDSGGTWQLHEAGRQLVFTFTSPTLGKVPYKTAVFDRDFSAGAVSLHRPYFDAAAPIYPLEFPLDELVITNWLALGRGVEIHGCAVQDADGAGYLFAGHSGAGKSTLAALWRRESNVTVFSDDRVILRTIGDQIWMYGTPWHGDDPAASPACARLTRGFFLRHGSRNELTEVGGAQTVARLLARSFPPFFSASGLEFTMAFLTGISRVTPFLEFAFVPDAGAIDFVRGAR